MAQAAYNSEMVEKKTLGAGYVFGAPVKDLGWFASLIMGVATGMAAFFLSTCVAIFSILFYNAGGHHADFTASYKWVGMPIGLVVMAVSLGYLGTFWAKRKMRRA